MPNIHSARRSTRLCAIAACLMAAGLSAAPLPAVEGEPSSLAIGETTEGLRLRNGEQITWSERRIDAATVEVRRGDGCSWHETTEDIYAPSLSWQGCGRDEWADGHAEDIRREGHLWPLAVGNKASYRYVSVSGGGKRNTRAFRDCEVTGSETVSAGIDEYATYRVECTTHSGDFVFNYSPELHTTVFIERQHNRRGRTVIEYVAEE